MTAAARNETPSPTVSSEKNTLTDPRLKNLRPFKKGVSGNPAGRGKGALDMVNELRKSLERVGKKKKKSFIDHFVETAYEDNSVLVALGKKVLPDLLRQENPQDSSTRIYILEQAHKDGTKKRIVVEANGHRPHVNGNGRK